MSFFSKSSKGHHYKKGNNGYNHYGQKGVLGNLFNAVFSGSHSRNHHDPYYQPYPNQQPYVNQPYQNQQMNPNQPIQMNQSMQNQTIGQHNNLICSKCNSIIPAGSKFCLECGERVNLELKCPNCKEKLLPNAKFCMNCGTKI